ncbi:MAG TPA: hypothetical protein VF062_10390 [Candidatus Limnocylindrales bacterium]
MLAIVVVLAVCLVASATAFVSLRGKNATASPDVTVPTPAPSVLPTPQSNKPGPECLIGDWLLTSFANTAEIYGANVPLTGKGSVSRYGPDGVNIGVYDNLVLSGTAGGDSYEVIHNGILKLNYVADDTSIRYSNPVAEGTTTWKVNGRVRNSEPLGASLDPDTYKCQGNELRLFWEGGASEYQRILPPGVPI